MFRILLARQGQTMEQGRLVQWFKPEGEVFRVGEELYEIESEKALISIQATRAGRIVRALALPGDTVSVGGVLAIAADHAEEVSAEQIDAVLRGEPQAEPSEAAQNARAPAGERTVRSPTPITAVPKARALAKELGVDLSSVKGTGGDGAITPDDVRSAAQSLLANVSVAASDTPISRRVPLSPVGLSIIAALEKGSGVPQFTQGILVDATELSYRRESAAGALTYMDFFLDALVSAAQEVPQVLGRIAGREMEYFRTVDVSIAAATAQGLLLAVLRDAGALNAVERGPVWRSLIERARGGKLSPLETTGGCLALSSLGDRGVDYGTPLLPAGHTAIVFFGSIEKRALVVGDRLEARPSVHVSITYDHRVVDGVLGARFTAAIRKCLETPSRSATCA
jgi:pyruvate dehydrogenase E2 component (dihydrolipoamide acetyltransferase)